MPYQCLTQRAAAHAHARAVQSSTTGHSRSRARSHHSMHVAPPNTVPSNTVYRRCDHDCWVESTFGQYNSVHAAFHESSYGRVTFTESTSAYVVIEMGYNMADVADKHLCPIDIEQTTARAKVIAAGYDPEMTYDMIEYLYPSPYGGSGWTCKWVGQAALCPGGAMGTPPTAGVAGGSPVADRDAGQGQGVCYSRNFIMGSQMPTFTRSTATLPALDQRLFALLSSAPLVSAYSPARASSPQPFSAVLARSSPSLLALLLCSAPLLCSSPLLLCALLLPSAPLLYLSSV